MEEPKWLTWAREVQAIAQSGLAYATDVYDRERYEKLRALAADMMAAGSGGEAGRIESLFAREIGYATPKVVVRAAVFDKGKILMVRETSDGAWAPPGGWADVNQSAAECLIREVREESGYEARIVKLAACSVWPDGKLYRSSGAVPQTISPCVMYGRSRTSRFFSNL